MKFTEKSDLYLRLKDYSAINICRLFKVILAADLNLILIMVSTMFYLNQKFKELKHCFLKKRWFFKGIYRSLNCGKGSKDNKANVSKTWIIFLKR